MNCPYCHQEMEKGWMKINRAFLVGNQITWFPDNSVKEKKAITTFLTNLKRMFDFDQKKIIMEDSTNFGLFTSYYCSGCQKAYCEFTKKEEGPYHPLNHYRE